MTGSPVGLSSSPPLAKKAWFAEIDGLRAVACLAVMFHHFNPIPVDTAWLQSAIRFCKKFMPGNLGVGLFFSMSAFLIAWLATNEVLKHRRFSWPGFFWRC